MLQYTFCLNAYRRGFSASVLLMASLVISGCQSTAKNDYDVNYDFSKLNSFTLLDVVNAEDPLTVQRVREDIIQTLSQQGFTPQAKPSDFTVSFAFKTEDKPKSSGLSIGLGTGSWGNNGGASIGTSVGIPIGSDTAKIQTIQIDIIDPTNNRLIWRGSDKYDFEMGGQGKADKTAETVQHILKQFPPKNTQ